MSENSIFPLVKVIQQFNFLEFKYTNSRLINLFHSRVGFALQKISDEFKWDGIVDLEEGNKLYGITWLKTKQFAISVTKNRKYGRIAIERGDFSIFKPDSDSCVLSLSLDEFLQKPYRILLATSDILSYEPIQSPYLQRAFDY